MSSKQHEKQQPTNSLKTKRMIAKRIRPTLLSLAIAQTLSMPMAQAATIGVDNAFDAGVGCTLRDAIQVINTQVVIGNDCLPSGVLGVNDTINFQALGGGVYGNAVNVTQGQLVIENDVTITGGVVITFASGPVTVGRTTISGNNSDRVFNITGTSIVTFDSLVISGGSAAGNASGGGISVSGSSNLVLNSSIVSANFSGFGGGVVAGGTSSLTLNGSTVYGNSALSRGGGIFTLASSSVTLNESTVSGNSADEGGGIYASRSSSVTLNDSTVSRNSASDNGGGIFSAEDSSITLNDSTVSENLAPDDGGGIYVGDESSITLSESTVSGNSASDDGGGIFVGDESSITLSNSTVSDNYASDFGGAIYGTDSPIIAITNSTISNNTADVGGGIYATGSSIATISNSTLSGNQANIGGGIFSGNSVTLTNSIVANSVNGDDCDGVDVIADNHNIIADGSCTTQALSVNPKLGPLQDNGGPTLTHALLAGSPAIDAGANAICVGAPINNLDQRGETRPIGDRCDIGAYESEFGQSSTFFVIPTGNGKTVIINL